MRHRLLPARQHEAVDAIAHFLSVVVKPRLQPGDVGFLDGEPPPQRTVDVKGQRLQAVEVGSDVRHVRRQQRQHRADVAAQLIGGHFEIAQVRRLVDERIAEFVAIASGFHVRGILIGW